MFETKNCQNKTQNKITFVNKDTTVSSKSKVLFLSTFLFSFFAHHLTLAIN
jgi:hypothetical protein